MYCELLIWWRKVHFILLVCDVTRLSPVRKNICVQKHLISTRYPSNHLNFQQYKILQHVVLSRCLQTRLIQSVDPCHRSFENSLSQFFELSSVENISFRFSELWIVENIRTQFTELRKLLSSVEKYSISIFLAVCRKYFNVQSLILENIFFRKYFYDFMNFLCVVNVRIISKYLDAIYWEFQCWFYELLCVDIISFQFSEHVIDEKIWFRFFELSNVKKVWTHFTELLGAKNI